MLLRSSRQSFLGDGTEERIALARVAIVGLCGGGSHIAQQLAHIGVGHFTLFDDDIGEDSNLNRMVGLTEDDVATAMPKIEVISRLIHSVNSKAKVVCVPAKWQTRHELLRDHTAIVGGVDSFSERDQLERYARRYLVPYIDVGMDVHGDPGRYAISGQVILSMPGEPCMRCMGFLNDRVLGDEARRYGNAGGKPQVVWPNGTLASIAVGKFMSLLTPWHEELQPAFYTEYDGNRLTVQPSRKLAHLVAHQCRHFGGVGVLGDPLWPKAAKETNNETTRETTE
jgi:molybdopterin-synthase adenylyltransferase